jgi:hypothetical protein
MIKITEKQHYILQYVKKSKELVSPSDAGREMNIDFGGSEVDKKGKKVRKTASSQFKRLKELGLIKWNKGGLYNFVTDKNVFVDDKGEFRKAQEKLKQKDKPKQKPIVKAKKITAKVVPNRKIKEDTEDNDNIVFESNAYHQKNKDQSVAIWSDQVYMETRQTEPYGFKFQHGEKYEVTIRKIS